MIDNRIHYYLVLDTETANGLDDPLVYDIGGVVADKQGRIYESFSFVIRDVFVYERELMHTAYYACKIPDYSNDVCTGKRVMVNFYEARKYILNLMKEYNIHDVAAYNAHFDRSNQGTGEGELAESRRLQGVPKTVVEYGIQISLYLSGSHDCAYLWLLYLHP